MNLTVPRVLHTGWRAIARRLGVRDIRTAKKLVKVNHIPVYRMGKSPRLDETIFVLWQSKVIEIGEEGLRKKLDSEARGKGR